MGSKYDESFNALYCSNCGGNIKTAGFLCLGDGRWKCLKCGSFIIDCGSKCIVDGQLFFKGLIHDVLPSN